MRYPSPQNLGTNLPVFLKLGRLVLEFEELEYLVRYPSPPYSGTNVQSHNQEDVSVSVSVAAFAADPQCVKPLVGGWVSMSG